MVSCLVCADTYMGIWLKRKRAKVGRYVKIVFKLSDALICGNDISERLCACVQCSRFIYFSSMPRLIFSLRTTKIIVMSNDVFVLKK